MDPERLRSEAKNGLDFRVFNDVCRIVFGGCIRLYRICFGRRNFILLWAAFLLAAVVIFAAPVGSFREGACTLRDPEAFESQVRIAIIAQGDQDRIPCEHGCLETVFEHERCTPAAGDPVVAASAHIEAAGPFAQVVHIDADCGEEAPLFGYVEEIMGVAPDVHRTFRFAGNDDSRFQPQRIGQAVSEIAADAEDGAPAGMGVEIDLRTYAPGTSVLCRCVESAE